VNGGGIYPANSLATVTATANAGNTFTGWTGDASGTNPRTTVIMNVSRSVVAHFSALIAQTIVYSPPGAVTVRTPPFPVVVSSTSGLPVTLILDSGPATLVGTVITPTGPTGEVTVTATQPGNGVYLAAPPVVISFAIGPPLPGVVMSEDSAATKRSDRMTRVTSFISSSR
jgi:uncharacterized repeat protein (TIGR02543 family)